MRAWHALKRQYPLVKVGLEALRSTKHPILVHMVPMRRCNLACSYCNEFDKHSPPVPTEEMFRRVDKLAELGSSIVTLSGGEPLLHPAIEAIIARIAERGILPELLTNAYLLTEDRIQRLNDAGLRRLQISIDNVQPDEVSKKSLKVLDAKLQLLAQHARFNVNVNSVLGSAIERPEDALVIARRARELGFTTTVGIIHDGSGKLLPLSEQQRRVYEEVKRLGGLSLAPFTRFKDNLVSGQPNNWRCRAGARYLYICEDGLVHYCSQQRGYPATPLERYSLEDIERHFDAPKPCAPYCTIGCVHAVAVLDSWRPQGRRASAPGVELAAPGADHS